MSNRTSVATRYMDFDLNMTKHPITGDIARLTDDVAIKSALRNLVLLKNHEVPFHPEIGCAVNTLLFDLISPITAISIARSIEDVINNFEPRVSLKNVEAIPDSARNGYIINITFSILTQPDVIHGVSTFLSRIR